MRSRRTTAAVILTKKGLTLDPTNPPLKPLITRAEAGFDKAEEKRLTGQRLQEQKYREATALRLALRKLGIKTRRSDITNWPDLEGHETKPVDETHLMFPVLGEKMRRQRRG